MALFQPPSPWKILGASGVSASITGTTTETALATVTIPAGAMGANGILRVTSMWAITNSVNTKTMRVRLGGIGGTSLKGVGRTTIALDSDQLTIWNRNSQSSQVAFNAGSLPSYGTSASAAATSVINTAVAQDLVLTATLTNTGETITLESYLVEIAYRP